MRYDAENIKCRFYEVLKAIRQSFLCSLTAKKLSHTRTNKSMKERRKYCTHHCCVAACRCRSLARCVKDHASHQLPSTPSITDCRFPPPPLPPPHPELPSCHVADPSHTCLPSLITAALRSLRRSVPQADCFSITDSLQTASVPLR